MGALVYTGRPRMSCPLRPLWPAALLAACAPSQLAWGDHGPEDPHPSGPSYLRAYKESHYRNVGRSFTEALEQPAFDAELDDAAILWLGDHHEDRELHARMLELITELAASRRIAIGLEAVGVEDEPKLGRFLAGSDDLDALSDSIRARWSESWLSHPQIDAAFYRSVLEVARDGKLPVFALEPAPRLPLTERDAWIADRIRRARRHLPDRLVVVVVGHAHLLGDGKLVARTGLPSVVVGARLSRSLRAAYPDVRDAAGSYLRTDAGVLFFNPPPEV